MPTSSFVVVTSISTLFTQFVIVKRLPGSSLPTRLPTPTQLPVAVISISPSIITLEMVAFEYSNMRPKSPTGSLCVYLIDNPLIV